MAVVFRRRPPPSVPFIAGAASGSRGVSGKIDFLARVAGFYWKKFEDVAGLVFRQLSYVICSYVGSEEDETSQQAVVCRNSTTY